MDYIVYRNNFNIFESTNKEAAIEFAANLLKTTINPNKICMAAYDGMSFIEHFYIK